MSGLFAAIERFLRGRPEPAEPVVYTCQACGKEVRDNLTAVSPRCACGSSALKTGAVFDVYLDGQMKDPRFRQVFGETRDELR